jgi:hypothetical protein
MLRRGRGQRHLAGAGALLVMASGLAPTLAVQGCHFPISPEVELKPEPPAGSGPVRAKKPNELRAGIRKLVVTGPDGEPADAEAGDERVLGLVFAEAVRDALIFDEVVYPLRDEEVEVILEPTLTVTLTKNRATNALKVLPGLILPWIDGMGFDYDYAARVEVAVRNPKAKGTGADGAGAEGAAPLCERLGGESAMIAERYPSVLWFLGIHVGLIILTIFESVTTDQVVLERLIETSFGRAIQPPLARLRDDFSPTAKPCEAHPQEEQPGRYCIIDGRDLHYPILLRGEAAPKGP